MPFYNADPAGEGRVHTLLPPTGEDVQVPCSISTDTQNEGGSSLQQVEVGDPAPH